MRIGVPTTSYPRTIGDPSGTFVRSLCLELVRRGHRCEVLAPDDASAGALEDPGIEVVRVSPHAPGSARAFYGAGVPDNVRGDPRALLGAGAFAWRLAREMARRSGAWDAVLSHWALPSAAAARLSFGERRHVTVWHSADVRLARALFGASAWPIVRPLAGTHVFVASHLRARLGAEGDARAHVVPMGVSPPARSTSRRRRREGPLRALVLARLVPIKRVELAIEACARADVSLVVAGDGPERPRLERLARARGAHVRFVGVVDEPQREALLAEADVLLACSAHQPRGPTEGYPVAAPEALSRGVVVLATRDPVHEELAARCGPPVILADAGALASSLTRLARETALLEQLSLAAPQAVARDAWPEVGARIERLLAPSVGRAVGSDLDPPHAGVG